MAKFDIIGQSVLSDLKKKFFWKEEGFFDLNGSELIVPNTNKRY